MTYPVDKIIRSRDPVASNQAACVAGVRRGIEVKGEPALLFPQSCRAKRPTRLETRARQFVVSSFQSEACHSRTKQQSGLFLVVLLLKC